MYLSLSSERALFQGPKGTNICSSLLDKTALYPIDLCILSYMLYVMSSLPVTPSKL